MSTITNMDEFAAELRRYAESIVTVLTAESESSPLAKRLARSGVDALALHASAAILCESLYRPDTTDAQRAQVFAELESADAGGTLMARLLTIAETVEPEVAARREWMRRRLILNDPEFAHLREVRHQ